MIITTSTMRSLDITYSTAFQGAFQATPDDELNKLAIKVPSKSKANYYAWLGMLPNMREWLGDRVIHDLSASDFSIKNRKFELSFKVERDEIEDDQYGLYTPMASELANAAKRHPGQIIAEVLRNSRTTSIGYDGVPLVSTVHPTPAGNISNDMGGAGTPWYLVSLERTLKPIIFQERRAYQFRALTDLESERVFMKDEFVWGVDARVAAGVGLWQLIVGSRQTLDATNFNLAWAQMAGVQNSQGESLGVTPTHLVVPLALREPAKQLLQAERLANGGTNTNYQAVELIISSRL